MNEVDIEDKAIEYANDIISTMEMHHQGLESLDDTTIIDAFKAGVNWALNKIGG